VIKVRSKKKIDQGADNERLYEKRADTREDEMIDQRQRGRGKHASATFKTAVAHSARR
jgi:hypothetical protein